MTGGSQLLYLPALQALIEQRKAGKATLEQYASDPIAQRIISVYQLMFGVPPPPSSIEAVRSTLNDPAFREHLQKLARKSGTTFEDQVNQYLYQLFGSSPVDQAAAEKAIRDRMLNDQLLLSLLGAMFGSGGMMTLPLRGNLAELFLQQPFRRMGPPIPNALGQLTGFLGDISQLVKPSGQGGLAALGPVLYLLATLLGRR